MTAAAAPVLTRVQRLNGRLAELGPRLERAPAGYTYVGRRMTMGGWDLPQHPLHNPHRPGRPCRAPACHGAAHTLRGAVDCYRRDLATRPGLLALARALRGDVLLCWCGDGPCHARVLAQIADCAERVSP